MQPSTPPRQRAVDQTNGWSNGKCTLQHPLASCGDVRCCTVGVNLRRIDGMQEARDSNRSSLSEFVHDELHERLLARCGAFLPHRRHRRHVAGAVHQLITVVSDHAAVGTVLRRLTARLTA
jgi:hypothetical protein